MESIKSLEQEIIGLKNQLKLKERSLANLKLTKIKDKIYIDYEDMVTRNEMELIYNLIFATYLCKEYKYHCLESYQNKIGELIDIWDEDIETEFKLLIEAYKELEKTMSEDEVTSKLSFYLIHENDLEDEVDELIKIFC